MHCTEARNLLDDHLDDLLDAAQGKRLQAHLDTCVACRDEWNFRRELQARLQALPIDMPAPGFAARALRRARQRHAHRTRGFATGFGSAVAAGLALWVAVGFWQPVEDRSTPHLQTITLQIQHPRTVSLAFNVPDQERFEQVRFRIELPPGVSLANRPGERVIAWQDRLEPGRNLLTLPLVAEQNASGDLVARIQVQGVTRTFRVPVRATPQGASHTRQPVGPTPA